MREWRGVLACVLCKLVVALLGAGGGGIEAGGGHGRGAGAVGGVGTACRCLVGVWGVWIGVPGFGGGSCGGGGVFVENVEGGVTGAGGVDEAFVVAVVRRTMLAGLVEGEGSLQKV